ncbi:MAG: ComEC/Rec2 family competence protein [Clostridia bacterium]|nr:ComEC/Rec2 family competence protein [Clostridia bacterium]
MQKLIPERNRILLFAGIAFFAGCLLARQVYSGPWMWAVLGIGLLTGAVAWLGRRSLMPAILICFCALGMLRAVPALYPQTPEPGTYEQITGSVYGEGRLRTDNRLTFTLTDIRLDGRPVMGRAYVSLYYHDDDPPVVFDGAQLTFAGRLYRPDGKSGEHRFDFRNWMLRAGMQYGITVSKEVSVLNTPDHAPVKDWAYRLKKVFRSALTRTMGEGADLAMALLFSDREGVEEQEYQAFNRLGIAHVMSVSGLHVGIIGAAVYGLLARFRLGRSKWYLLAAFLLAYCGITGFSAASTRAAVMLLLNYSAEMYHRPREPLNNLGAAILVVLILQPLQAYSAGLVLSVSAVLGIYLIKPGLSRLLGRIMPGPARDALPATGFSWKSIKRRLYRAGHWLADVFAFSLSAQLGVLLPTALYFHQLPVYGVFINVLIVPYISLLVPLFMAALVLSPVPWLGQAIGWVAAQLGGLLMKAVTLLNTLPAATVKVGGINAVWLLVAVVAAFAVSGAVRSGVWQRIVAVAAATAVAAAGVWLSAPPATRYIQLAVGQADAALLFDRDKTIAIDTGVDGSATLDYLTAEGRDIDVLYLTHLHIDHSGGVPFLLDSGVSIGRVYLPVQAAGQRLDEDALAVLDRLHREGIPVEEIAAGQVHAYPTVTVTSLWPDGDAIRTGQDANDLPMVLSIEMGGYTILSTADLTGHYENYAAAPADVLKVAHHGSSDSTGDAFLDTVSPQLALISCSSGSRSLPGHATLERLQQRNIPYLRTDESGDITIFVKNGQLLAAPYKGR